jgi:hypothetical protein
MVLGCFGGWMSGQATSNKQSKCKEAQGREEKEKKRGEL